MKFQKMIYISSIVILTNLLLFGCNSIAQTDQVIINQNVYQLDYFSILEDLRNGKLDSLRMYANDSGFPDEDKGENNLGWRIEDFLLLAENIHFVEWNESVSDWFVAGIQYEASCSSSSGSIDGAKYWFYKDIESKSGGSRIENFIVILPSTNYVMSTHTEYHPAKFMQVGIPFEQLVIGGEKALEIAEQNVGQAIREETNGSCMVLVSFRWTIWKVIYSDLDYETIVEVLIDPKTGKYEIVK